MLKNNENSSSILDDITKVVLDESTEEEIEDDEPAGFPTGVENRWGAVPPPLGGGLSKFDGGGGLSQYMGGAWGGLKCCQCCWGGRGSSHYGKPWPGVLMQN